MLTTEFLGRNQFSEYGSWLKRQDPQTLHDYFGYTLTDQAIESLVKQFAVDPQNHHFLVAKFDGQWAGTIHIATHEQEVEFGVIVALQYRKQGIANMMGYSEANLTLQPPTPASYFKEHMSNSMRNWITLLKLQKLNYF